ncbi:uncharacterized protein M421DRAFT_94687 [Didymella exigua CBS 183.55]|uniref:RING-type domain-containing protein n=1 Tax=Didymella exigua CBS 183.55 TaxID=1150837 RepID=A0A6A5RD48_9PLEO|nr:uncharacterized protein M421DRAFT_94687 [Didymella exigua CBS 183.55]KAF1925403.1 hypothetical protein M421DRAFT_94687 [Didymella exigua CBS 183.55]
MAASDFSTSNQYTAMSTGAGARNADVSHPWCPAAPSYPPQQQQQQQQQERQWRQELNQTFPQHNFSHLLPPPPLYSSSPYGHPRAQYLPSPYASYDGQHPLAMHYPQSTFSYPPHPPRLPPAIRSGRVEELLDRPCPDVYHGGSASHGTYHTWPQGLPPSASGRCPAWRSPQPAAMTVDTPNLPHDRGQPVQGFGIGSSGMQQSQQIYPPHPRLPVSNQPPQLRQNQGLQSTRTNVIRHDGHTEVQDPSGQIRRSDRSSSPRTSARRSFDRYSGDMTNSSTSSDAEEAAARSPPANRMRRAPREGRPRFYGQVHDPNVIIGRQIKELKASLVKYLLGQLPEVTSPTCDICAKDYSATSVQPSEEKEIAVMLPCGHVFGEFCIDQWFDTCKTHKNKITCPMCRKQLVAPPPSPYRRGYYISAMSYPLAARSSRPFEEPTASDFQPAHYARV